MQKNEVVSSEEIDISDQRKEKIKKLFEYEETRENGKIVLLNKKLKLVQLTDCKEDREIYKTVITDYKDFLHNFRKLDTNIVHHRTAAAGNHFYMGTSCRKLYRRRR